MCCNRWYPPYTAFPTSWSALPPADDLSDLPYVLDLPAAERPVIGEALEAAGYA